MSLDLKLLGAAKDELSKKKRRHAKIYADRHAKIYKRCPNIKAIDIELRAQVGQIIKLAVKREADKFTDISNKGIELQEKRKRELVNLGLPPDYLDENYMCEHCRDTGYRGIRICSCLLSLYKKEQKKALSSLLKLGTETFDNFNLNLYDDTPTGPSGVSPRKNMRFVLETCRAYAEMFGKDSFNLFLNGAPGLGKTFLSACIARDVADKGYSVVYDMCSSIFAKFETEKFSRNDESAEHRNELRRYLECDLLIIDDLGTEMSTAFTISALYELINTRLINSKKTVINSNLTLSELRKRYSSQIMSRLEGEYQVLPFFGRDIRQKKLEDQL